MANDAELRATAPQAKGVRQDAQASPTAAQVVTPSDPRLPIPGGVIVRDYKGRRLHVKVLEHGLEFEGQIFKSLSAVAKHITGNHCDSYLFFRLPGGGQ